MADPRLIDRLSAAVARLQMLRLTKALALGWLLGAALVLLLRIQGTDWIPAAGAGVVVAMLTALIAGRSRTTDLRQAVLQIEKRFPELDSRLLTAIEQHPRLESQEYSFLQMQVLTDALRHARESSWKSAIPLSRVVAGHVASSVAFVLFAAAVVWTARNPVIHPEPELVHEDQPAPATPVEGIVVHPGDAEVERGTGLLVTATFGKDLPSTIELVAIDSRQQQVRIPLTKSLSDPVFGARIPNIQSDLVYRISYDGQTTDDYRVTTFDYPRLEQADAVIRYPSYVRRDDETLRDISRMSVLEGSTVRLEFRLNKPVERASLTPDEGEPFLLEQSPSDPTLVTATLTPTQSTRLKLRLIDDHGRENRDREELQLTLVENRPVDLQVTFPARDVRVSPLQEVSLEGTARDDFGIAEHGLVYFKPDGSEEQVVFGDGRDPVASAEMSHLLALEQLGVEPDELISFYFYADDLDASGQPRRSFSDIFFAEVRPFEEIYRQSQNQQGQQQQQQQQQQQGQQQSPAGRMLEIQRQIVSATWNVLRRERNDPPSSTFADDVSVIAESQTEARDPATGLAGQTQDVLMREHLDKAISEMSTAADALQRAASTPSVTPLPDAQAAAQAAYQALLKLQAREHQVQMSQASSSQSQSGSQNERMNQQLSALELKNDRHRYETEQQAAQQQSEAAREALQVLNRLKELARRQEDLNEQIRQLENELCKAETEERREELQRQLKRLEEQQQELLRDTDELRERMNREQNRDRMAEQRQQLDQARERVFEAAQALREGQTTRAVAEGTRAERQFEQLEDEVRRQTAGEFDEAVRQLREDASQLAENQQQIARQLGGESPEAESPRAERRPAPSLRPAEANDTSELVDSLVRQQNDLGGLLERMRELVEASETAEPLLSKSLYDTVRNSREDQPEEALQAATELLRRGFPEPARQAEEQARRGIDRLREGIERSASTVLGDETEALRRARDELAMLTDAVGRELRQNDPQATPPPASPTDSGEADAGQSFDTRDDSPPPVAAGSGAPSGMSEDEQSDQPRAGESPDRPGQPANQDNPEQSAPGQDRQRNGQNNQPGQGASGSQTPPSDTEPTDPQQRSSSQPSRSNDQQPGRSEQSDDQQQRRDPSQPMTGQPTEQGNQPATGEQPGEQQSSSPAQSSQQGRGQQPGQPGQPGQSEQSGQQPGQEGQAGGQSGQRPTGQNRQPTGQASGGRGRPGLAERLSQASQSTETGGGGNAGPVNPLTGEAFMEWSDRMRNVEEMVADSELRSEVAAIRERARAMRIEFKRHSKQPNWELVRTSIFEPMRQLEQRIAEDLARRSPEQRLVPIGREPVPDTYAELVQKYFEELSRNAPSQGR